uniref:Heat shock protein 70 n=1 Tax=Nitzschia sp. IriIs04 TaxID=1444690 RepID=A0A0S3QPS2_9STRA|nr:heat shock protein 70 [Nitzschia sp. IriIs04]BAT70312.1 heat shock protein 70 [Nitzschia sp. IriIs04]
MTYIGIDLGTTNSVVATIKDGIPYVIPNSEGSRTTPSIVAYTKNQKILVGKLAKRQSVINPKNTFFSIKRFIGLRKNEIDTQLKKLPYDIIEDSNNNIKIKCPAFNTVFSPEEISAQIIRKLTDDAKLHLNEEVTKAVITIPAYFNASQRQATIDAGKIAGLEILRIINEPTAASLAYGLDKKNKTILVFDLGGGTFDVSILDVSDNVFEVLATTGDVNLGGDDFDKNLISWLIDIFNKKENLNILDYPKSLQRLTEAAEQAKIQLSTHEETEISLPFLITKPKDGGEPRHLNLTVTRKIFEKINNDLINRCKKPVEQALLDAKLDVSDLDDVVLVGGSTRIPAIKELIRSIIFEKLDESINPDESVWLNNSINPDEAVAIGAALQAGILAGDLKQMLLLDVTPLSLGVETIGEVMTKIINRNTTVPASRFKTFITSSHLQRSVEINVLQGEREFVKDNQLIGSFYLNDIPTQTEDSRAQIDITFDINENGILEVKAQEKKTKRHTAILIENTSTLDDTMIQSMVNDAEKYAEQDKEKRKLAELSTQATVYADDMEKEIELLKPTINRYDFLQIKKAIQQIRNDLPSNNFKTLKSSYDELIRLINLLKIKLKKKN